MNFVALLLGLGVERLLTQLFHLREFRWLDPLFDKVSRLLGNTSRRTGMLGVMVFSGLMVAPVALASIALAGALYQIPKFALAVIVLLFSLGPRDLKEEVSDYCTAVDEARSEDVRKVARELIEDDPPEVSDAYVALVERAVFIQANNRIFGVVFWFLVLGPAGAWLFRVLDMMRRRLAFSYSRNPEQTVDSSTVWAVRILHGILAWVPARLLSAGYAMAGSFDDALSCWRNYHGHGVEHFFEVTNDIMACIGHGAVASSRETDIDAGAAMPVRQAMNLVSRTLWWIWCPIIAILTLSDWLN